MIWANKKRGKQIEDPELHKKKESNTMFIIGFLPTLMLFGTSLFIPIQLTLLSIIGVGLALTGLIINIFSMYSFATNKADLNTKGIYKFSRNPMYIGGFLLFSGFGLIGWELLLINHIYSFWFVMWMISTHIMVMKEERFLEEKYKTAYTGYKNKVHRYLLI